MIYDKLAAGYDRALAPFERWFLGAWRRETFSLLPPGASLLEIGAGTGANFRFYPSTGRATATDISLRMLAFARRKTDSIALVQSDAGRLPFAENSFDAAFATLVFCSLAKPENAFAELKRVVKANGRIVLLEHVRPEGRRGYFFDLINPLTVALIEDHFNRQTAKTAAACGLKILEVRRKAFGIVNLIVCENE